MKKIFILGASIAIILPLILISVTQLYFRISYPEKELKDLISDFFKKEIRKAVKFESIRLNIWGNIVLENFNMSAANDFNDNLSLIKCDEVNIDIQFLPVLYKEIKIDGIYFNNATIELYKRYGVSYGEFLKSFDDFFIFIEKVNKESNKYSKHILVSFTESKLIYKEAFKESKSLINLTDVNANFDISKNSLQYIVAGRIDSNKGSSSKFGVLFFKGNELFQENKSRCEVVLDDIDLSYANDFIAGARADAILLKGSTSAKVIISREKSKYDYTGKFEINNLHLKKQVPALYSILSNDNIDVRFDIVTDSPKSSITIRDLHISDETIDLRFKGEYTEGVRCMLYVKTNSIDFERVSSYFSPFKGYSMSGIVSLFAEVQVDFKNKEVQKSVADISVKNFTVYETKKGAGKTDLNNFNASLNIKQKEMLMDIKGLVGQSDWHFALKTLFKKWFPVQSDTVLSYHSSKVELPLLYNAAERLLISIYDAAYQDRKIGYDEVLFLQKPIGKILNSNNFIIAADITRIEMYNKSHLDGFTLLLRLDRGILSSSTFKINGYDAQYSFNFFWNFNTDYPYLKAEGKVSDFLLEKFSSDSGLSDTITGKANLQYEYELSFSRISSILDNSKGHVSFSMNNGVLKNSKIQQQFIQFFKKHGYEIDADPLKFSNITLNIAIAAENFYVTNTSIQGESIIASAFGNYTYSDGYGVTLNASARDKTGKFNTIPMEWQGKLLEPCFYLKQVKDKPGLCVQ